MARRDFAALMLAGVGALALTNDVRAQGSFIGADGCAVLAQLVYAELTESAWSGPSDFRSRVSYPGENQISVCNQTTRTVSKAFTLAMTSIGSEVHWGYPFPDPGDYCMSGFLDQCYPDRYPPGDSTDTWIAVSKTVQQAMPNGTGSDQSIFSSGTMRLALRSALASEY